MDPETFNAYDKALELLADVLNARSTDMETARTEKINMAQAFATLAVAKALAELRDTRTDSGR
jgi:hypothetical protein